MGTKRTTTTRRRAFVDIPVIEPGMCGHCRNWTAREDAETGICAVLAVAYGGTGKQKRRIPDKDTLWTGKLERMVHERTMAATNGEEWVDIPSRIVDAAENWSGVPRFYFTDAGEKRTVWEPLETHEWGSCSRHESKGRKAA